MITSAIGKKFLTAYNNQNQSNLSAKDFFEKLYVPLFFDRPKYMMTGGNSPLENPKIQWKKGLYPSDQERKERIKKTIAKIESSEPDASIAIGFPSLDYSATTSGQITNIKLPLKKDDIYLSWIGAGLGVGVEGGMAILFDNTEILMSIFEGWQLYRGLLDGIEKLSGNQITTWNGQWLAHRYNDIAYYREEPMANFNPLESSKEEGLRIPTQNWVRILIGIAKKMQNPQMVGYVYNLGQTNTTIGFIPFILPKIRKPIELYKKIFGDNEYLQKHNKIEELFGSAFGFTRACQKGAIGIEAMEPKGLREMIIEAKYPNYKIADDDKIITYNTYQIWILAMLNNEQLWDSARSVAEAFHNYAKGAEKAKKDRSNNVKAALDSTNKKQFIENLISVVQEAENKSLFEEIAKNIISMPLDNVPYFLTLIRFQYTVINN